MAISKQVEPVVSSRECRMNLQYLGKVILTIVIEVNINCILQSICHLQIACLVLQAQ